MNVIDAIYDRRAVRTYSPRLVQEATLRTLLRAAVHAPSAMNAQAWLFAIIQNRETLARYSEIAKSTLRERMGADQRLVHGAELLADPRFNVFYDAGTLVVIGSDAHAYADADCWLAAEAFMLAALVEGLGTCPIGFAVPALNRADLKAELGFPATAVVVAPLIVGYPSSPSAIVPRNDPRIVSWKR